MENYQPESYDQKNYDPIFSRESVSQTIYATEDGLTVATQFSSDTTTSEGDVTETVTSLQYFKYLHSHDDMI